MGDETGTLDAVLRRAVMMLVFIPIVVVSALFLISPADRGYLDSIANSAGELGGVLALLIYFYGTPAYVMVLIITKAAELLRISLVKRAMDDLEEMVSMPLSFFAIGFSEIYFLLRHIELDEEKDGIRLITANIAGVLIFASFYARQLPAAALALAAASGALFFVSSVWNLYQSKNG